MPRFCVVDNCNRRALYGINIGTYCNDHKKENMKIITYQKKKNAIMKIVTIHHLLIILMKEKVCIVPLIRKTV